MNLQEAKHFVAIFVKGEYTPEGYADFLQWLRGATVEELNAIADEHEVLYEQWDITGLVPSDGWKAGLEGKLDRVGREAAVPSRMIGGSLIRGRGWIAAASLMVLLAGGVVLYTQRNGISKEKAAWPAMSNVVVNPSGGAEKQMLLPDGSRVLLNVASTLKYPATFTGSNRVVELSGEAFFEVSPDASNPFRVLIKDANVGVLGTNFNVRAYADEPVSQTTLLDGSVEMESGPQKLTLKPGQQAVLRYRPDGESGGMITREVDIDEVMEWKKGYFRFTKEELQVVTRVLARYYNVDIQCDQNVAGMKVSGSVSRDKGLQENLSPFKSMGVKIDSIGKRVKVTLRT